jgi:hypothetical protein
MEVEIPMMKESAEGMTIGNSPEGPPDGLGRYLGAFWIFFPLKDFGRLRRSFFERYEVKVGTFNPSRILYDPCLSLFHLYHLYLRYLKYL